jgi:predicted AAA+ superfamily ATPase
LLDHSRWFSPGTPASSTTKTGRHDIAEILLKVALSTKNQIKSNQSKQKRLNTSKKVVETKRSLQFNDHYDQTECQDEDMIHNATSDNELITYQENTDGYIDQLHGLISSVVEDIIQAAGQLHLYIKFNELLANHSFPTDNICYLLFLGVVTTL